MNAGRPIRAYFDTSVFGGVFDDEFASATLALFERVEKGRVRVVVSDVTLRELGPAPEHVRLVFDTLSEAQREHVLLTAEAQELAEEYVAARCVSPKWLDDALHVALATVARVDVVVSWNFRHIVRFDRVRAFNAVNLKLGYPQMSIVSPQEVLHAGDDETV